MDAKKADHKIREYLDRAKGILRIDGDTDLMSRKEQLMMMEVCIKIAKMIIKEESMDRKKK